MRPALPGEHGSFATRTQGHPEESSRADASLVFLDALHGAIRQDGRVEDRDGICRARRQEGRKDVLGLWTSAAGRVEVWLYVLAELRNRGVRDIYLICMDGLKGFPHRILKKR